jgi:hypothetical protein
VKVHPLFKILKNEYPEQLKKVFSQDMCEIDPSFLGFMDAYEALSKIIPTQWTIIDIGCGYGAQSYYFRNHKQYIGILTQPTITFNFDNSVYWTKTISQITRCVMGCNVKQIFAILNYVPCSMQESKLVRDTFPNLYCYYPHGEKVSLLKE